MSIERDKDFEQLEDIAAMMTENPGIEFENGKYVYYGLDGRTAFAAVYISGAWSAWQAKANAVPEKDAVIKKLSDQLYAQEMKASAARVLCETACELLDDYAHQDAMVILNDLEQAMKEPK